jgi:GR25 family glycosyltransferase involved in LPS biosynthesis
MDRIDVVFYINLDHRTDRRAEIESELQALRIPSSKIIRIPAIMHPMGIIGCCKSHIMTLEQFIMNEEWTTCLVLEDDFSLKDSNYDTTQAQFNHFFNSVEEWDVLSLSYNSHVYDFSILPTNIEGIGKVMNIQTTSGYCITKTFAPILLQNFKEGCALKERNTNSHEYCLDQYWKRIQPAARWYAFVPAIGHQRPGYSDIEKKAVNYDC